MRQDYSRRGRRRGVYISPALVLAAILLTAVFAVGMYFFGRDPAPDAPGAETPEGGAAGVPMEEVQPSRRAQHVTTDSGIACTLRDLGEEALYEGELILVNNWTSYHFPEHQELSCIYEERTDSYIVRDTSVYVAPAAMGALNDLMDAFRAQGGSRTINVIAGYRTEADQQGLFDRSAERNGLEHARKYVAQPGGSEHHTGYAVDLHIRNADGSSRDYDGTGEYAWINENCQDYGFVVRYDQAKSDLTGIYDEPWHFRYVGAPHAAKMVEEDLCLEEYVDYLKKFTFGGEHLTITCGAGTYEVWYTQGTEVYVPDSGEYTLSGNNVDGVIVTCRIG